MISSLIPSHGMGTVQVTSNVYGLKRNVALQPLIYTPMIMQSTDISFSSLSCVLRLSCTQDSCVTLRLQWKCTRESDFCGQAEIEPVTLVSGPITMKHSGWEATDRIWCSYWSPTVLIYLSTQESLETIIIKGHIKSPLDQHFRLANRQQWHMRWYSV